MFLFVLCISPIIVIFTFKRAFAFFLLRGKKQTLRTLMSDSALDVCQVKLAPRSSAARLRARASLLVPCNLSILNRALNSLLAGDDDPISR